MNKHINRKNRIDIRNLAELSRDLHYLPLPGPPTKRVDTATFMLLKQDVGLASIMRVSCLFVQKMKG